MSAVLVLNPSQDLLQSQVTPTFDEIANIGTTPVKRAFLQGQTFVEIAYLQGSTTTSTGKFLYVSFNRPSDQAALIELSQVGLRIPIPLGEKRAFMFSTSDPCVRIDFVTDTAETGTSKTILTTGA